MTQNVDCIEITLLETAMASSLFTVLKKIKFRFIHPTKSNASTHSLTCIYTSLLPLKKEIPLRSLHSHLSYSIIILQAIIRTAKELNGNEIILHISLLIKREIMIDK